MSYYSTPAQVISYTGVKPKDLGLSTDAALNTLLVTWLEQIKDIIDIDRNRDYTEEGTVPKGIVNIALRMAANQVGNAMIMRDSPIIQVSEFTFRQVDKAKIIDEAIEKDLQRYPKKLATPIFRLMRVRTEEEIEEGEEEDEEGS